MGPGTSSKNCKGHEKPSVKPPNLLRQANYLFACRGKARVIVCTQVGGTSGPVPHFSCYRASKLDFVTRSNCLTLLTFHV